MEEILEEYINMPKLMEFLKKVAKTTWLKIQTISVVQISKNAKTVVILKDKNLETKVTVGLHLAIPFGK